MPKDDVFVTSEHAAPSEDLKVLGETMLAAAHIESKEAETHSLLLAVEHLLHKSPPSHSPRERKAAVRGYVQQLLKHLAPAPTS